jgi:hypothetical protein
MSSEIIVFFIGMRAVWKNDGNFFSNRLSMPVIILEKVSCCSLVLLNTRQVLKRSFSRTDTIAMRKIFKERNQRLPSKHVLIGFFSPCDLRSGAVDVLEAILTSMTM